MSSTTLRSGRDVLVANVTLDAEATREFERIIEGDQAQLVAQTKWLAAEEGEREAHKTHVLAAVKLVENVIKGEKKTVRQKSIDGAMVLLTAASGALLTEFSIQREQSSHEAAALVFAFIGFAVLATMIILVFVRD